jgi:hypothetical protein
MHVVSIVYIVIPFNSPIGTLHTHTQKKRREISGNSRVMVICLDFPSAKRRACGGGEAHQWHRERERGWWARPSFSFIFKQLLLLVCALAYSATLAYRCGRSGVESVDPAGPHATFIFFPTVVLHYADCRVRAGYIMHWTAAAAEGRKEGQIWK